MIYRPKSPAPRTPQCLHVPRVIFGMDQDKDSVPTMKQLQEKQGQVVFAV